MLGAPIRLVVNLLFNLVALVRLLPRLLRRPPDYVVIELKGALPERPPRRGLLRRARGLSLEKLARLCDQIARVPRIRGVLLHIHHLEVGWARLESLRALVLGLRARGLRVVAHLSGGGNAEYALAAACDLVYADESAPLALTGLAAEAFFLKGALDRVGVRAELCAIGEYKSAAEPLTREGMSEWSREATRAILDALWERLVGWVAEARKHDLEATRAALTGGPYTAARAVEVGLVDAVLYQDELPERLGEPGRPARLEPVERFARAHAARFRWRPLRGGPRAVAVVSIEGLIAGGEGGALARRVAAADAVRRALTRVRESRRIAGVVLHVDSRGGAADASDLIWREVVRTAREKPVVGYLGDVAASGGYYIVAPCRHIVAQPMSLTGSIGVIGGKIVVDELMAKAGVGLELLAHGEAAAMTSPARGYSSEERRRMETELRAVYDQFVSKVAEGRRRPREEIEKVARGRVWTGAAACERGLIDELGGLGKALERCREAARRHPGERLDVVDVVPESRFSGSLLRRLLPQATPLYELGPLHDLLPLRAARAALVMPLWLKIR